MAAMVVAEQIAFSQQLLRQVVAAAVPQQTLVWLVVRVVAPVLEVLELEQLTRVLVAKQMGFGVAVAVVLERLAAQILWDMVEMVLRLQSLGLLLLVAVAAAVVLMGVPQRVVTVVVVLEV